LEYCLTPKNLQSAFIAIFVFSLLLFSCKSDPVPTEEFVLAKLNEEIKPPLAYQDLTKIDSKRSKEMGEDVYWMKYKAKLIAKSDLQVFTKRGFSRMDTFYVADSDSSYLKMIADDIRKTEKYNKQFGEFTTSYKEINEVKKGETIKEVIGGINLKKTENEWVKMK